MAGGISKKGLTSWISFVSFLIMGITGIVLYFEPQGRVAYWTQWKFLGLSKTGWDQIHITSSVLFTIAAIYHLTLNWRAFLSYLREKAGEAIRFKAEAGVSLAVGILLIAGTIYGVPPLSSIVEFSRYLKEGWVTSSEQEPPYGHAELSRLSILARKTHMEPGAVLIALRDRGIDVTSGDEVFGDIARRNHMSPMELFGIISYLVPKVDASVNWTPQSVEVRFEGTGIGHKELRWIMKEAGVEEAVWISRLANANISAMSDETIKQAAERSGIRPIELLKSALIDGYVPERE